MRVVVCVGGPALAAAVNSGLAVEQPSGYAAFGSSLRRLAAEHEVIVTFGLPSLAPDRLSSQPRTALWMANQLALDAPRAAIAVQTRVLVDRADPAFDKPTAFVGACYAEDEAQRLAERFGWQMAQDGIWWRQVVAAPPPVRVLELGALADLVAAGNTVFCSLVPVSQHNEMLGEVEAVVDADLVAAHIAGRLVADALILLTTVSGVLTEYGSPQPKVLREATVAQLRKLTLTSASIGAKVSAACSFVESTGATATIGSIKDMDNVIAGRAGTRISSDDPRAAARARQLDAAWDMLS